eukprot:2280169-Rhodomonas_salina.2
MPRRITAWDDDDDDDSDDDDGARELAVAARGAEAAWAGPEACSAAQAEGWQARCHRGSLRLAGAAEATGDPQGASVNVRRNLKLSAPGGAPASDCQ